MQWNILNILVQKSKKMLHYMFVVSDGSIIHKLFLIVRFITQFPY